MKYPLRPQIFWNMAATLLITLFILLHSNNIRSDGEKINSIKAIINDEIITELDVLRRAALAIKDIDEKYDSAEFEKKVRSFYNEALEELIDRKVLVQTANKAMLTNELKMEEIEKDVDAFIKGAVKEVGSLSKFYEIASEQGVDPLGKKRELRDDLMVERILKEHVYKKITVNPKEIKEYYNVHLEEFYREKQVSFRQILIKFSEYEDPSQARKEIEILMDRLKKGEDFATLAKNYSHGPHASKGGLWTFDEVNDFRKDLLDIVLRLDEGKVSDIIESDAGYHIFRCEEIIPASYASFQEAQDEIYQRLFREKFIKKKKEYMDGLKKDFYIRRY